MSRLVIGLALILAAGGIACSSSVQAADLAGSRMQSDASSVEHCDDYGCFYAIHVRHRVLLSTYGADLDPRNYDFTEPHYYYGGERTYVRYSRDPN